MLAEFLSRLTIGRTSPGDAPGAPMFHRNRTLARRNRKKGPRPSAAPKVSDKSVSSPKRQTTEAVRSHIPNTI
jgi:hypothetical protein